MQIHSRLIGYLAALLVINLIPNLAHAAPPNHPPRIEDTIDELNLQPEANQKVDMLVDELHSKERAAREEFLDKLKTVLTPEDFEKVAASMHHGPPPPRDRDDKTAEEQNQPTGTVLLTGGHDTDPQDHGRPVILVASGLGVPTEVFRQAFSGVTPARNGPPEDVQVRRNKEVLLKVLSPYGITNDQLDTVSNYYRYRPQTGELWKNRPAKLAAVIQNDKIVDIKIDDAGAGYSSPPRIEVAGHPEISVTATLHFGTDLSTNGSIESVKIEHR